MPKRKVHELFDIRGSYLGTFVLRDVVVEDREYLRCDHQPGKAAPKVWVRYANGNLETKSWTSPY
jgi:hypothetical protein